MSIDSNIKPTLKSDFNKTANEGFSIQNAIKKSILKQNNMNTT